MNWCHDYSAKVKGLNGHPWPNGKKVLLCSEPQPLRAFYYEKQLFIATVDKEFFFPKVSDKHLGESDLVEGFKFVLGRQ